MVQNEYDFCDQGMDDPLRQSSAELMRVSRRCRRSSENVPRIFTARWSQVCSEMAIFYHKFTAKNQRLQLPTPLQLSRAIIYTLVLQCDADFDVTACLDVITAEGLIV